MFYIDDTNSKTITNSPPKREDRIALDKAKKNMEARQLSIFWYLAGITIANNFTEVKSLLSKYGYGVVNEEDAAAAMADMLGTAKWAKFVKEFGDIMENVVDERIVNQINSNSEESGWVEALISAVGSVASPSLTISTSGRSLSITKETAKDQMQAGVSATLAEKEKLKVQLLREEADKKRKKIIWIIISLVIVAILIGIFIYKRRQRKKNTEFISFMENNK